jgi:hypothetical protein
MSSHCSVKQVPANPQGHFHHASLRATRNGRLPKSEYDMETLLLTQWIAKCAERLHQRWTTVDFAMLEEVAMDLWKNTEYRTMEPIEATTSWLTPIVQHPSDPQ